MKNLFKKGAALMVCSALMALVACSDDKPDSPSSDPKPPVTEEVNPIPYPFQDLMGKSVQAVHEMLGESPYAEDADAVVYKEMSPDIEAVTVSFDSWRGAVTDVAVQFKSSVNPESVVSALEDSFLRDKGADTGTEQAYLSKDNSVAVKWNVSKQLLVYTDLNQPLFRDYSVLLGMTRSQVIVKMGMEPVASSVYLQYFEVNNHGVTTLSTNFTHDYEEATDNVVSVMASLDESITVQDAMASLEKEYIYQQEFSDDSSKVFMNKDNTLIVMFTPADKTVFYALNPSASAEQAARNAKRQAALAGGQGMARR